MFQNRIYLLYVHSPIGKNFRKQKQKVIARLFAVFGINTKFIILSSNDGKENQCVQCLE